MRSKERLTSESMKLKTHRKRMEHDMVHNCLLPPEEDILVRYIDSGYFVDLRRKFRRLLIVSDKNPRSKYYLKSILAIKREKERHLQRFYYMIHPFSQIRFYWELCMLIILLTVLIMIPIQLCQRVTSLVPAFIRLFLDILCVVDIIITFNTGYQDSDTKQIILSRGKVAKHYLLGWFILDFITSINVDVVILYAEVPTTLWYVKVPAALKILRIMTLIKYLNRFRDYKQLSLYTFRMLNMCIVFFFLILWTTCLLYIFARDLGEPWLPVDEDETHTSYRLLVCLCHIINLIFLVTSSEVESLPVLIFEMICLTMGVILQFFFLAQIHQLVSKYSASTNKYYEMLQQLRDYMQFKKLPENMMKHITCYFDFRFQKNFFKEDEILVTLSHKLIDEINIQTCERLLDRVTIFKGLPFPSILKLVDRLTAEIFLPNEVIVKAGTIGDTMYFISSGKVAVYSSGGKEICHLSDGANFGEVCLIMEHCSRVASIVAIDYCDMFTLTRAHFHGVVKKHTDLYKRLQKVGQDRMKNMVMFDHTNPNAEEIYDFNSTVGVGEFKNRLYEL